MIEVTLTADQELRAARIGFKRRANALKRGLVGRHYATSQWEGNAEGACSELAAALALDVPWTGEHQFEPPFTLPDIGERTEVRWARRRREPRLIIDALRDKQDRLYVLVTGFAPVFLIHGLILGADARRPEWLHHYEERDVYRVPAIELRQLELAATERYDPAMVTHTDVSA